MTMEEDFSALDLNRICRACLSESEPLKDLFIVCTSDVFRYVTSIQIVDGDPRMLCQNCLELLIKLCRFKQAVIKSNKILLRHQKEVKFKDEIEIIQDDNAAQNMQTNVTSNREIQDHNVCIEENANIRSFRQTRKRESTKIKDKRPVKRKKDLMKCVKCEKIFHNYDNLEAHVRSHFGKKPDVRCKECDKSFTTIKNLASHMRVHTGVRKYQCLSCGKSFAYLNVLKNHERTHAPVKRYECHLCGVRFLQQGNWKVHLNMHHNEKNFSCPHCSKKFTQSGNLKTHLKRHSGIKDVACTVCHMRFYVKGDLRKHMKSHSVDKPFSCDFCDKTFKNKGFQVIHLRTHTGERPYACDVCPKRFMSHRDLKNHRMIHTGEKPHRCQLCDHAFIQKCALNRHLKSHVKQSVDSVAQSMMRRHQMQMQGVDGAPVTVTYSEWQQETLLETPLVTNIAKRGSLETDNGVR